MTKRKTKNIECEHPPCPFCNEAMLGLWVEQEDHSQIFGWTCNCETVRKLEAGKLTLNQPNAAI